MQWCGEAHLELAITRRHHKDKKLMLWGEGEKPFAYALIDWKLREE